MKRDMDLIREILLAMEEGRLDDFLTEHVEGDEEATAEVLQHMKWIDQAGFADIEFRHDRAFAFVGMTWAGSDFLDAVRGESVWEKTKEKVKDLGGEAALETIKSIAVSVATAAATSGIAS